MSEAARGRATGQAFLTYDVVVDTVVGSVKLTV